METMIEKHLPGVNHKGLDDEAFFRKFAHLEYIRNKEAERSNGAAE